MASFDYMVCSVQLMHVTFINGQWQGNMLPDTPGALDSCPNVWDFLQDAGNSSWELVAATSNKNDELTTLYLKRQKTV